MNRALSDARRLGTPDGLQPFEMPYPAAPRVELPPRPEEAATHTAGGDVAAGAAAGAALGSLVPGIGTLAGAAAGALWGGLRRHLKQQEKEAQQRRREAEYSGALAQAWLEAADGYLDQLVQVASSRLAAYAAQAATRFAPPPERASAAEAECERRAAQLSLAIVSLSEAPEVEGRYQPSPKASQAAAVFKPT